MSSTVAEPTPSIQVKSSLSSLQSLQSPCDSGIYSQSGFFQPYARSSISSGYSINISDSGNTSSLSACSAPSTSNCIHRHIEIMRPNNSLPSVCMSLESSSKGEILEECNPRAESEMEVPSESSLNKIRSRKRPTSCSPEVSTRLYKDHSQNIPYNVSPEEHRQNVLRFSTALNRTQAAELRFSSIAEHVLKSLSEYGWAVVDNFLGSDHCWNVNSEIQVLESRGLFSAGQLVEAKNMDEQHVRDIRSDKTYWFSGSDSRSSDACTVRMLINYLDGIVNKFSSRLLGHTIYGRSKAMLAIYPGHGSRYVKHVDNPAKDGRRITVIYYCNPGWEKKDGGVLRMYPSNSGTPFDIEPRADRLLFFWSDNRIPHEVMPVYKDRYAITVWYMDRVEREEYFKRSKMSGQSGQTNCSSNEEAGGPPKSPKEHVLDGTNDNGSTDAPSSNGNGSYSSHTADSNNKAENEKKESFKLTRTANKDGSSKKGENKLSELQVVNMTASSDLTPEYLI